MAQDSDDTDDKLSLSFRRKGRGKKAAEPAAAEEPVTETPGEPATMPSGTADVDETDAPVATDADAQTEAEIPEAEDPVDDEATVVLPADEIDEPESTSAADQGGAASSTRRWWSRSSKSEGESDAGMVVEETTDDSATDSEEDVTSATAEAPAEEIDLYAPPEEAEDTAALGRDDDVAGEHDELDGADQADAEPAARRSRSFTLPAIDGRLIAIVTGLVVGVLGVALTYLFQRGCQAVKGTGSCGGIGVLLLIVVLVAMVFAGGLLLSRWRQPDGLSTSFLAVGIVAVVAMLAFLPLIDRWYMIIVIPLLSAATYLLSWWVTVRVINGGGIGEGASDEAEQTENDDLWDGEAADEASEPAEARAD